MKKWVLISLFITLTATAGKWTIVWDQNPEPDVTGYKVYEIIGGLTNLVAPTATNGLPINNVANGQHTYFVVATNSSGLISDPSTNLVVYWPSPPGHIQVK